MSSLAIELDGRPIDFDGFHPDFQLPLSDLVSAALWLQDVQPTLAVRVIHQLGFYAVVVFLNQPDRPVLLTSQDYQPEWVNRYKIRAVRSLANTIETLYSIGSDLDKWLAAAKIRQDLLDAMPVDQPMLPEAFVAGCKGAIRRAAAPLIVHADPEGLSVIGLVENLEAILNAWQWQQEDLTVELSAI